MTQDKKGKAAKKNGGWSKTGAKIVLVMACILFVGVMIITSLGTNWLVTMKPAEPGDSVVIDVTLRDEEGRPMFTTNEGIYAQAVAKNQTVWKSGYLNVVVNSTTSNWIEPIPSSQSGLESVYYAFLGPEMNQIAQSLVGMKEKSTKHLQFEPNPLFSNVTTSQVFDAMGGNFSKVAEGQQMVFAMSVPQLMASGDNSTQYALRTALLKDKTNDTVTIDYGYKTADITILKLTRAS